MREGILVWHICKVSTQHSCGSCDHLPVSWIIPNICDGRMAKGNMPIPRTHQRRCWFSAAISIPPHFAPSTYTRTRHVLCAGLIFWIAIPMDLELLHIYCQFSEQINRRETTCLPNIRSNPTCHSSPNIAVLNGVVFKLRPSAFYPSSKVRQFDMHANGGEKVNSRRGLFIVVEDY